jgi:flavin-dependent dehydrogenase
MIGQNATTCDALVIGSGAGGLGAAITAKKHGLDVLVIEKARRHFRGDGCGYRATRLRNVPASTIPWIRPGFT